MQENQPTYIEDDEITLKELIQKLQEFWREVWKHWLLIGLIILPIVAFMLFRAFTTPVTYPANLTFMVNEDEGNSIGAMAGILGSFGLGGGAGGKYNLDKILELSRSRKIVQMALFEKAKVDGVEDYFANHIIRVYKLHKEWEDDTTGLVNFLFTHDSLSLFTNPENKALQILHKKIIGDPDSRCAQLLSSSISEETGIMTMAMTTESEDLSIQFLDTLYSKLSHFYVEKSIEKQQHTYDVMKSKTDSLHRALSSTQYQLLKFQDTNRGLSLRQFEAKKVRLQTEAQVLAVAYGEALKNLELADFSLKNATPFVQVIDQPIPPIKPKRESKLKALIIGCFLGGFLGVAFVLGRKIIRDAMI